VFGGSERTEIPFLILFAIVIVIVIVLVIGPPTRNDQLRDQNLEGGGEGTVG